MSKTFLDKLLFEPFARAKCSVIKNDGTGLGMAIVLQRVHSMNGYIGMDSSLGVGTTVTVSLPFERYTEINTDTSFLENNEECQFDENVLKGKKSITCRR